MSHGCVSLIQGKTWESSRHHEKDTGGGDGLAESFGEPEGQTGRKSTAVDRESEIVERVIE